MEKYLLFSYLCYYPTGGMGDCILVTENLEELNSFATEYIKNQGYADDFMEYYDCKNNERYMADCALLKKGVIKWELQKE